MTNTKPSMPNRPALVVAPLWARVLSVVSLGSLWAWFLLKLSLQDTPAGLAVAVGSLALLGAGGSFFLFATRYRNEAYAGDHELDERELALRNRAHRYALNYVLGVLMLTYVALETVGRATAPSASALPINASATIPTAVLENFLFVLFFTTISLPPAILAWWDRGESRED
jgi:hypothetical protein